VASAVHKSVAVLMARDPFTALLSAIFSGEISANERNGKVAAMPFCTYWMWRSVSE